LPDYKLSAYDNVYLFFQKTHRFSLINDRWQMVVCYVS